MSSPLSSLVDNLSDGLHNNKSIDCKSCLGYISTKDNLIIFKSSKFNKNHNKNFYNDLIKRFANIYELCDGNIKKFILLLRKGVCAYEYTESSE